MSADTSLIIFGYNTEPNRQGKRRMYRVIVVQAAENLEHPTDALPFAESYLASEGTAYRSLSKAIKAAEQLLDYGAPIEYGGPSFYFVNRDEKRVQPMRRNGQQFDRPLAEAA